jgi:hypothetical protein
MMMTHPEGAHPLTVEVYGRRRSLVSGLNPGVGLTRRTRPALSNRRKVQRVIDFTLTGAEVLVGAACFRSLRSPDRPRPQFFSTRNREDPLSYPASGGASAPGGFNPWNGIPPFSSLGVS